MYLIESRNARIAFFVSHLHFTEQIDLTRRLKNIDRLKNLYERQDCMECVMNDIAYILMSKGAEHLDLSKRPSRSDN